MYMRAVTDLNCAEHTQAHKAYLETTEHRTQAFKQLTRNDAQVCPCLCLCLCVCVSASASSQLGCAWEHGLHESAWAHVAG